MKADEKPAKVTGLLDGLTDKSASNPDASMRLPKGPSVDSGATRDTVAKSSNITKGRTA